MYFVYHARAQTLHVFWIGHPLTPLTAIEHRWEQVGVSI